MSDLITHKQFISERIEEAFMDLAQRQDDPAAAPNITHALTHMLACWDAYHSDSPADALTEEERDVLTIWDWITEQDGVLAPNHVELWDGGKRHDFWADDGAEPPIHAAAEWVRQQEAER